MDCRGCSKRLLEVDDLINFKQGPNFHLVLKPEKIHPIPSTLKKIPSKGEVKYAFRTMSCP